jgi:hypothetical protein
LTVLKLARNANTDGWGNKLVTIFARHHDCFIMTINFLHFCQFFLALDRSCNRDNFIFRQDLQKLRHGGLPTGTIFWLKYRDSYRRAAPPTFTPSTAGPLCLRFSAQYRDSQRTSKSLAAATVTPYAAAKHMLFLPTLTII